MTKNERALPPRPKHRHGRFRAHAANDPHRELLVVYRSAYLDWMLNGWREVESGGLRPPDPSATGAK
jgi:hypothetical protein